MSDSLWLYGDQSLPNSSVHGILQVCEYGSGLPSHLPYVESVETNRGKNYYATEKFIVFKIKLLKLVVISASHLK